MNRRMCQRKRALIENTLGNSVDVRLHLAELCELALQQLAGRTDEGPRDSVIGEVGGPVALGGFLRIRLVVEQSGLALRCA